MPIHISEANQDTIRVALVRHHCHTIANGLPPHADAPDEARAVARSLAPTLALLGIMRGGRRPEEVRLPERRAAALERRLAEMMPGPPASAVSLDAAVGGGEDGRRLADNGTGNRHGRRTPAG